MNIKEELAEIPSDGAKLEDIIKEEEKETPEESPTENKPEEEQEEKEEEKQEEKEEDVPFHKHPRFKELVEEKNQYKEELKQMREEMESKFSEIKESRSQTTEIPDWFQELYGENELAWKKYQQYDKANRDALKKEIRAEVEAEKNKEKQEAEKWATWVDGQIDGLKNDGLKFQKNELMKVMTEYKPTDENGNLDFRKGYEIMTLLKTKDPKKSEARKKLASDDKGKGNAEPEAKKWFTPQDMRGQGWDGLL